MKFAATSLQKNMKLSRAVWSLAAFVMFFAFGFTSQAQYCAAGASVCDEYIGNVTVAGINNSTGCGLVGGYSNYTAIQGNMTAGLSYPMTVYNPTPWSGDVVYVWVDWNNNNTLGDVANEFTTLSTSNYSNFTGTIACPAGTLTGQRRMRVRISYSVSPGQPCGTEYYGEVEDYTINVAGLGDPPPTINITTTVPGCPSAANQTVVATITDNGTVTAARVWFRKNGGTWYNAAQSSLVGTTYTFIINHSTMGGVVGGDVVEWYLAAIDNSSGVSTMPSGGSGNVGGNPGSTPPAAPYSYTVTTAVTTVSAYSQNFDGPSHGWTLGGTASSWRVGAPLGTIGPSALSTPNALVCQNTSQVYNNNEQSWAMSPSLDFSSLAFDPVIMFDHKYYFETSYDGGWVEYTTNGGSTWIWLGTSGAGAGKLNWYNAGSVYANSGPCWNGQSTTAWIHSVHALTGLAGKSCVQFRFRFASDASVTYAGWAIDNVWIGYTVQKDVSILSTNIGYAPNRWAVVVNQNHTISATIQSNGWDVTPTSVTLVYKVGSMPATSTDGVAETFTPAWVSGRATCNFTTPYTPTATGPVTMYVRAFLTGDQDASNDSRSTVATVQTIDVYGYEDFQNLAATGQPLFNPGWTVINNGGANTWGVYNGTFPPAATTVVGAYISDGSPDDYLISPPALLQAGSSYRVRFKYATCGGTSAATIRLLYGTSNVPAQMTVHTTWTTTSNTWVNAVDPLTTVAPFFNTNPAAAQNYYIAIQVLSPTNPAGIGCVAIDDVILDVNPTPPPKIGYGPVGTPQGGHVDNPAVPMTFSAVYKKPGILSKTFEVVSTTYNYGAPGDFLWDVTTNTSWIKLTKSQAAPRQYPTLGAPNGYNPPRPRQNQTFQIDIDPTNFAPGTYIGQITMYGSLYNSNYPSGIKATNEPYVVTVQLIVVDPGTGGGGAGGGSVQACKTNMTTSATPYTFTDVNGVPFAAVTVTTGTIPSMCITAYLGQVPTGLARYRYVQRYFNVSASGSGWKAQIHWVYTDGEAAAGGVTMPDLLRCVRQPVAGGSWQDPTAGVTSTAFPLLNYVTGASYDPTNIGGNHCLVTNYFTPKLSPISTSTPSAFDLDQNYPNPFNPSTNIAFSVAEESKVTLVVFSSLGSEVVRLVDEVLPAGQYSIPFNAADLPSGTYIYKMTAGSFSSTKRMLLSK